MARTVNTHRMRKHNTQPEAPQAPAPEGSIILDAAGHPVRFIPAAEPAGRVIRDAAGNVIRVLD